MLRILKMSLQTKVLFAFSSIFSATAFAGPFASNDSASRAMGGAGVASAQTYASSYFNPSLLAADAGKKGFGMMLPSATVTFDDSSRLLQGSRDYFDESFEVFTNYDLTTITTLISGSGDSSIIGSFDAVAVASTAVSDKIANHTDLQVAVDIDTEIADLISANDNLQANLDSIRTEIANARTLVSDTLIGLEDLENRPLQASAGVAFAAAIPSKKWGASLFVFNDLLTGVNFEIATEDTQILNDVIGDFEGMVNVAVDVGTELSEVVVETAELSQIMVAIPDEASWTTEQWQAATLAEAGGGTDLTDAQANLQAYTDALAAQSIVVADQVNVAQTESERLETYDGNYVTGGEFTLSIDNRPDLISSISLVGANIAEMGISLARTFTFGGEDVNIGITPKFQRIDMFDHTFIVERLVDGSEIEEMQADFVSYIQQYYTTHNTMNVDLGVSKDFNYKGNIRTGLVIRNLLAQTFTSEGGSKITIPTQVRVGVAHTTKLTTLALDLDITENEPLSFGEPTQFLALGAEFNLFGHAKVRAGYRNNFAVQNGASISAGLAFTPFGIGVDAAAWFKPTGDLFEAVQDSGVSVQLSSQF